MSPTFLSSQAPFGLKFPYLPFPTACPHLQGSRDKVGWESVWRRVRSRMESNWQMGYMLFALQISTLMWLPVWWPGARCWALPITDLLIHRCFRVFWNETRNTNYFWRGKWGPNWMSCWRTWGGSVSGLTTVTSRWASFAPPPTPQLYWPNSLRGTSHSSSSIWAEEEKWKDRGLMEDKQEPCP